MCEKTSESALVRPPKSNGMCLDDSGAVKQSRHMCPEDCCAVKQITCALGTVVL